LSTDNSKLEVKDVTWAVHCTYAGSAESIAKNNFDPNKISPTGYFGKG